MLRFLHGCPVYRLIFLINLARIAREVTRRRARAGEGVPTRRLEQSASRSSRAHVRGVERKLFLGGSQRRDDAWRDREIVWKFEMLMIAAP